MSVGWTAGVPTKMQTADPPLQSQKQQNGIKFITSPASSVFHAPSQGLLL